MSAYHESCRSAPVPAADCASGAQPQVCIPLSAPWGRARVSPHQVVAVDLSCRSFYVYARPEGARQALWRELRRAEWERFLCRLPPGTVVAMEACGGCNHWARQCRSLGLRVRIISACHTARRTRGRKDDRADARAIHEAALLSGVAAIPVKDEEQSALLGLLHARRRLGEQRTAACHQLRHVLHEQGVVCPAGVQGVLQAAHARRRALQEDERPAAQVTLCTLTALMEVIDACTRSMEPLTAQVHDFARRHEDCRRLLGIRGLGEEAAAGIVCHSGDIGRFRGARQFAEYFRLAPGHTGSGGRVRITGVRRRGMEQIRRALYMGAIRVIALSLHEHQGLIHELAADEEVASAWLRELARRRRGIRKLACIIAHRLIRMAFAVLRGDEYDPRRDRVAQLLRRHFAPEALTDGHAPRRLRNDDDRLLA